MRGMDVIGMDISHTWFDVDKRWRLVTPYRVFDVDWAGERLSGTFADRGGPVNPRLDMPAHDYRYGAAVPLPAFLLREIERADEPPPKPPPPPKVYDRRPRLPQYQHRSRVAKRTDAVEALKARDRVARAQLAQDRARPVT